jgi:NAD(P)-dependent dehydrogenase (short-subunit alcohol dehydrogenase family)
MFTRVAALELGPRGINVNGIAPGSTLTPLYHAQNEHTLKERTFEERTFEERPVGCPQGEYRA